jgi:hypothetical protein
MVLHEKFENQIHWFAPPPKYIIKHIIIQVHQKKKTSTEVIIYHIMNFQKWLWLKWFLIPPLDPLKS